MFRALTIAREYGSGASVIARRVADKLGWELLDQKLIWEIAWAAQVDIETAIRYDERADSWWHCFHRSCAQALCLAAGAPTGDDLFFDARMMVGFAKRVIAESAAKGNCVIVGRGAECVLQNRSDVLHAFIYGPWEERALRIGRRLQSWEDVPELLRVTDTERANYIHTFYGCDWKDPHLYHMMISSQIGSEAVASQIVDAIHGSRTRKRACESRFSDFFS